MATKKLEFSITAEEAGTRLDRCLSRLIPGSSRSYLQKLIRDGMVRADGAAVDIPRYPVRAGMRIEVDLPEESSPEPSPEPSRTREQSPSTDPPMPPMERRSTFTTASRSR